MALRLVSLALAVCVSARGVITEAPAAAVTPAPEASCPLTNSIPSCGIPCLISAGGAAGCFNPLDLSCQCKVAAEISSLAATCVMSSCGPEVGTSLQSVAAAICTECAV